MSFAALILVLSSASYVTGQIAFKSSVSAENCCKDSCEEFLSNQGTFLFCEIETGRNDRTQTQS